MSGALLQATGNVFRQGPPPVLPLFDVHVNLGITDGDRPIYGRMEASDWPALMRQSGTRWACVFPPLLQDYAAANGALRDWAAAQGPRLLPFVRLGGRAGPRPFTEFWQVRKAVRVKLKPPPAGEGLAPDDELSAYAGVKLIPHLNGLPAPATFRRINDARLPVLIHCGVHSPPAWMEKAVLPQLPDVPIILAHLGNFPGDASLVEDAVALAGRVERVHLDTSAAWLASFITYAAARVPGKVLYGSDAPLVHPTVAWEHVASAVADDAVLERIAWRNAAAVFAPWFERHGITPDDAGHVEPVVTGGGVS